jgi:amino acid adenylation domain-containing protein
MNDILSESGQPGSNNSIDDKSLVFIEGSVAPLPRPESIHERIIERALQSPNNIAVISEEETLTYLDLDNLSAAIADSVISSDPEESDPVGVLINRSARAVAGILGILRTGRCYVPIDPAYPRERILHIVEDAGIKVVVTSSDLKDLVPDPSLKIVTTDPPPEMRPVKPLPVAGHTPAYIIYTSGSTGLPKGVCCKHESVINIVEEFQNSAPLSPGDLCSWWTNLTFDVSVYEIFSPLIHGATVVVVPDDVKSDGPEFVEWLFRSNISSAYIPPFMVADLGEWARRNAPETTLRRLLVGVEPIPHRTLNLIQEHIPQAHIMNGYGPTEATVCATLYSVNPHDSLRENTPIGKPIQNTVLVVLDDEGRPVPSGTAGELYIGGKCLATGYLNRPQLTSERFITNPFSKESDSALFKTGDVVRVLEDGNLEFIGRKDFQVKIRGVRVEPGEIESQIRAVEGVREAVVIVKGSDPEDKKLISYFVVAEGKEVSASDIRERLRRTMPDYMIPAAFVKIDKIPFTSHGKTDREALPDPGPTDFMEAADRKQAAPRTPTEATLVGFFKELLKADFVGVTDNFFELGGQSLLAVRLASKIRSVFGVNLPIAAIFKSPTAESLAKAIEISGGQAASRGVGAIKPHAQTGKGPLSYSQLRVWYLDQLEPGTPAFNICLAYRFKGHLNLAALNKSLNEISIRHHSLRTVFAKENNEPVQIVTPQVEYSPPIIDLTHMPEEGREDEALTLCNQEFNQGFDLQNGPLFRWIFLHLAPEDHFLVLNVHHIVSDGWSMGILIKEIVQRYTQYVSGEIPDLPDLSLQYTDYAWWQSTSLTGKSIQPQINYWKSRFSNVPDPLDLPTDRPRPPIQSYRGAGRITYLDEDVCRSVRALAAREGATLFMVLLAGLKALLYRYNQQTDLCVGTFVANRNRADVEDIVGFFVNTLAIRTDLSDNPSFETLVRRVRENSLGAYANQDVPFEKVLEEVNPPRNLSYTPLFQIMMVLQNMARPELDLPLLRSESIDLDTVRSNFDITLWLYESGERIKALLDYSTDLFDDSTIRRMLDHFKILIRDAADNPTKSLSELALLSDQETWTICHDWSGKSASSEEPEVEAPTLFQQQVGRNPKSVALIDPESDPSPGREFTYEELSQYANKVGAFLRRQGVGPESFVALLMERGRFLITAILGTLKAGGAYVPIDTKYPEDRIAYILNDSSAPVIFTDRKNRAKLNDIISSHKLNNIRVICLDEEWETINKELGDDPPSSVGLSNAAYVIYTSGSTGQPKGTIIEHKALASFINSAIDLYGFGPKDRILQFSSPSFDASIEEIFGSLLSGAALVLRPEAMMSSLPTFMASCEQMGITVLDLPTAFWHQMTTSLEEKRITLPPSLRAVIIGGEQPSQDRIQAWLRLTHPSIKLFNTYGPTETTVVATAIELSSERKSNPVFGQVPVGRPLRHVKAYVLDSAMNPTPMGIPGELHLGGAALARGYLNLPDRTNMSFVPNPFNGPSGRLYKTGDRVRFRENGYLEFLGRIDRQVKIRGFRVELGEVESALNSLPNIDEAVAVAWSRDKGPSQIAAYVIPKQGAQMEASELREVMGKTLPDFMIPASFTFLESFPMTTSGKIDTRSLPEPEISMTKSDLGSHSPRTPIEETLVEIWGAVFGLEKVGIRDNFFDLGGHSLLSLQIIDRINRAGLTITPAQFMQNPTIAQQAEVISTANPSGADSADSLVELQPYGTKPPLFFIHSTPGDVLGYVNLINHLGADQPCYGFQSLGLKHVDRSHTSLVDMAAYYIEEMRALQPNPPYHLVGWCFGGLLAAEMAYQLTKKGEDVGLLVLIETPFPKMSGKQVFYYFNRLMKLVAMGPRGWKTYLNNRLRFRRNIKSGAIDKVFSLDLNYGPLANRTNVYKVNKDAIYRYRLQDFLSCPIRLFCGDDIADGYIPVMEDLWIKMNANVKSFTVPGNHLTILKEPGATIVSEKLKEYLEEVQNHKPS